LPSPAWAASIGTTLAGELARLDRGEGVGRHSAFGLDPGRLERLPGLVRDLPGNLVVSAPQGHRDADEDLRTLVRGQRLAHRCSGRVDRLRRLGGARLRHPADDLAGVGRAHLEPVARLDPLSAHEQLLFGGSHGHEG
jgi:hypothetical protein